MKYTIKNISKSQIASLCEIQDEKGIKLFQRDNNLEHIFNIIEFTKENQEKIHKHIKEPSNAIDLSFQIDYPQILEKIAPIVGKNPSDSPEEIVSEYLNQSAILLGFSSIQALIENLDFQLLH